MGLLGMHFYISEIITKMVKCGQPAAKIILLTDIITLDLQLLEKVEVFFFNSSCLFHLISKQMKFSHLLKDTRT